LSAHILRVSTIRSQNPKGFGGCIFTGIPIDEQGNVHEARAYYVVRASNLVLGNTLVQVGQSWRVSGEATANPLVVNGYRLTEWQIDASDATLSLPSGEHIITLMAESADFKGVGFVKARKLWERFGEALYDILDRRDVASLLSTLNEEIAQQVVAAWGLYGDSRTLQWLQAKGFNLSTGRKVLAFFGADAAHQIEADPYRLLSFCATWEQVDRLARQHFGVVENDARRLQGAVEEACYRLLSDGHTVASRAALLKRLAAILGTPSANFRWSTLISSTLSEGLTNGSYVLGSDNNLHPLGPLVMETVVARAVVERLRRTDPLISCAEIDELMAAHEAADGITLNHEQRLAVQTASTHAFFVITGGAGVGKTTVLKALYRVYDSASVRIYQIALAGRAAKRMQEATERPASTIASFLTKMKESDLLAPCVVVVDEASMVDIITMSRVCELLPSHVRLLLVGDPNQLMPVGPGLVLHALAATSGIPLVELKEVKRHGGNIAAAAHAIRDGIWPDLPDHESAPITFIPCAPRISREVGAVCNTLADAVLQLYKQSPENTQILSSRRNGIDGAKGLNALCQNSFTGGFRRLAVWNREHGSQALTGFHRGDPLLCTRNIWAWGLQNGSLGKLVEIEDEPRLLRNDEGVEIGYALAWAEWDDGERRPILETMLDDLELGYAITVHKAQGSQWERVIVPITGNRLLDRTLVYTAVTRAQRQVILIGDERAARKAVEGVPRAHLRQVALGAALERLLPPRVITA
jgi:exodeoxyribonuclease V alpha subunit